MKWLLILILLASVSVTVTADDLLGAWIGAMQENDLVVRTDRHYTQGLKLTYLSAESSTKYARWADCLPDLQGRFATARWGWSIGQNIYTPTDITLKTLQPNDRPYAGWLYTSLLLQRHGETEAHRALLDNWQLDLGIVGPEALGELAQNTVHRLRNFGLAQGWANQINSQPGVNLKYLRTWRYVTGNSDDWETQFLPHAGASLGSVQTYAAAGGTLRAGWRLPRDFGVQTVDSLYPGSGGRPSDATHYLGTYVFAGVEGRAMAYNTFLDGGLFHNDPSVPKHPFVGDLKLGWVITLKHADLGYTQIIRSKEFAGQKGVDAFGSLALTLKW